LIQAANAVSASDLLLGFVPSVKLIVVFVESVNVAAAASVCFYESARQRA
jgi:hypothetical protein